MAKLALFGLAAALAVGCGKKKDEESDAASMTIPSVAFTLPTPSGAALTAATDVLTHYQQRMNNVIERLNKEIEVLNNILTKLEGTGTFKDKGPNNNVSGTIAAGEDGTYDYSATICVGGKVFSTTTWKSDGSMVVTSRDLNNAPVTDNQRDLLASVSYSKAETEAVSMQMYGEVYQTAPTGADGSYLTEYFTASKNDSGAFTISAVNDWEATKVTTFTPDGYIVGTLNTDGSGEFVAHAKRLSSSVTACADALNEASPTWCFGRAVGGAAPYTADEKVAAWSRLSEIGLTPKSRLSVPTITGVCP